jgi:hypothetical protein
MIGPDSPDFSKVVPWSAEVEGIKISWAPRQPYLTGEGPRAEFIIEQVNKFLAHRKALSTDGLTYKSDFDGQSFPAEISSPYAVVDAIDTIYSDLGDDSEGVKFSPTTPNFGVDSENDEDFYLN